LDYFCIDVESSGPTPGKHSLLSVGVTHVRRFQGTYQPFQDLYVELKPVYPVFDEAAMAIHKLKAEDLIVHGLSPKEAMQKIIDWVRTQQQTEKERPVFVAHNAPFDWMFFAYYCGHFDVENPFGHSALDTKPLAMGKLDLAWNQTSMKTVAATLANVPPRDISQLHHAGADARYLAVVFCALMNYSPFGR
jgi:DNA polymerase III epsilon subunit-like protein